MSSELEEFRYSPFNLAVVISNRRMKVTEIDAFLTWVINNEREHIQAPYRDNPLMLFAKTQRYLSFLHHKKDTKAEQAAIAKDNRDAGLNTNVNAFIFEANDPHHFLKSLRLRILYFNESEQARTTLRQILKHYGYRRRNHKIIGEIEEYLDALDLVIVEDNHEVDLFEVKLDDRIVFKAKARANG